jgi:hypothetical protein
VHIHVKVHVKGRVVHTGQLYFPDSLTDAVYRPFALQEAPGPDDAKLERLRLRERRAKVDAEADPAAHGRLRRRDHDGRAPR